MSTTEIQPDSGLCDLCRCLDLAQLLKNGDQVLLGPLEDFFSRPGCAFCRLVTSVLYGPWVEGRYLEEIIDSPLRDSTMGLCYLNRIEEDDSAFFALTVPTARYPAGQGPPIQLCRFIYPAETGNSDPSMGRFKGAQRLEPTVNFAMVRQWLEDSDEAHPLRGTESEQNYDRLPSNFRVIDVQRRCLVEHRHQYRYVALSYVWGSSHMLKTTKSTFHQLSIDGAFNNSKTKLPEVVESALEFLQGLSERYLWVDALCIVQDDEVDVLNQISRMDAIYSSSYATLIAAAGTSSQSRLLGLPNSPRIVKQSMETIQGETYIAQSPTLGDKLLETVWYTRGWTYQEHELSSRRIFVFDDEFFFENENTIHCESSWRSENALAQTLEAPWGTATSTSNKDYVNYFVSFFFNKVNDYTRRNLTYPNDILNAFAGLCMSLQNNGKIKIRSGLPLESLHQGLFWDTARISSRRLSTFSHQGSTWIFPSWSWIGWTGIIRHDSSRTNYAEPEIDEGCIRIRKQKVGTDCFLETELLDCWCEVLELQGWFATFRISHHDTIVQQSVSGQSGNDIRWRIFDEKSMYCGIANLSTVTFEDADAKYCCLLVSRSHDPEAAIQYTDIWQKPRAVTIQSKEEASKYLVLPYSSTDWSENRQTVIMTSLEKRAWAYLNVIVLRHLGTGQFYERVGTGQIHEDAWTKNSPESCRVSIV